MTILFYITVFLFSLGQLGRVSFFNQQINFYLYEIVLLLSLFVLFFKHNSKPIRESWKNSKAIFLFLTILSVSLLIDCLSYTIFENIVGIMYLLRLCLYFIYYIYLRYHTKINKHFSKIIKNGILIVAILTIISTVIQYFLYPDLRNLFYQGWDPHLYRTFGVFFDTSIAATIFAVFFLTTNQPIIKIIYLVLIALSFSRSIYISLSLALIYLYISKKQFKKIVLFLLMFAALIFAVPKPAGEGVNLKRIYSINSRAVDYKQGVDLWKNKPIFGYGYNRIRYIKNSGSVHSGAGFNSSFLTILVSSGIMGLASFVWVLWGLKRSHPAATILIVLLSLVSVFDNVFLHPFVLFLFFVNLSDK